MDDTPPPQPRVRAPAPRPCGLASGVEMASPYSFCLYTSDSQAFSWSCNLKAFVSCSVSQVFLQILGQWLCDAGLLLRVGFGVLDQGTSDPQLFHCLAAAWEGTVAQAAVTGAPAGSSSVGRPRAHKISGAWIPLNTFLLPEVLLD